MTDYRVIVTGSRSYDDRLALRQALDELFDKAPLSSVMVVVCGCEENPDDSAGADRIAQEWALEMEAGGMPVRLEAHPARWEQPCRPSCGEGHRETWRGRSICPAAGPYRNTEMTELPTDCGLVALRVPGRSEGTKDCARKMRRAAIPVQLVVQGHARGLPEDLIGGGGGHVLGRVTRRSPLR